MTVRLPRGGFQTVLLFVFLFTNTALAQTAEDMSLEDGRRFVAVGQLASVRAPSGKGVHYVLMDEMGEVAYTLRPSKSVNLSRYIGQEVGVTARTLVDSDTPILLAESVTTFGAARQVSRDDVETHVALAAHQEEMVASNQLGYSSIVSGPIVSDHVVSDHVVSDSIVSDGYPIVGETIMDSPVIGAPLISDSYYSPPCVSCGGTGTCGSGSCSACPCGLPGKFWIRAENLIWWTDGMDTPALVTSSPTGTSPNAAGVLGAASTETVFGDEALFTDSRSGGRFRIGKWCDQCNWLGFETDFFFLAQEDQDYVECNIGPQIIARPFFNAELGREDSEIVQFPGLVNGAVKVDADSSLWSIGPRLRVNLACEQMGDPCCGPRGVGGYRFDLLVGYRYMQLQDDVRIRETLATVDPTNPTFFELNDSFSSENDFHGADLGFLWEGYRGPWSLELIGRIGIGSTNQQVSIDGSTTTSNNTTSVTDPGGLLALESNIGNYSRNEFSVLPEMSVTLGYAMSQRTRFLVGYTFIYWDNVVRAGDQIDLRVNPSLLPPVQATDADRVPAFDFAETSYWAQGLSLGLEHRW